MSQVCYRKRYRKYKIILNLLYRFPCFNYRTHSNHSKIYLEKLRNSTRDSIGPFDWDILQIVEHFKMVLFN
jgi:hypothetical protein